MPFNPVVANSALTAGLAAHFDSTYETTYKASAERLSAVMEMDVPMKARTEPLGYFEEAGHIEEWPMGEEIPEEDMEAVGYSWTARRYGKRMSWNEDDEKDDQLGQLVRRVSQMAEKAALRFERAFFDLLQGTTNFLSAVPNGPDGAAFFAATAGGAARFGATGGNLLTGNNVDDVASIVRDYYQALEQGTLFVGPKGQPLHDPDILEQGVVVIHPASRKEEFERAFFGTIHQGIAAGISNLIKDTGKKFKLWGTPRVSTADWWVFFTGVKPKATAHGVKEGLTVTPADSSNSDRARDKGLKSLQVKARDAYTVNLPYGAIQINN